MLTKFNNYLGSVGFGSREFLDKVAQQIGSKNVPSGDYEYGLFPSQAFGQVEYPGINGDFSYSFFPYPAPNEFQNKKLGSSFGSRNNDTKYIIVKFCDTWVPRKIVKKESNWVYFNGPKKGKKVTSGFKKYDDLAKAKTEAKKMNKASKSVKKVKKSRKRK